MPLSASVTDTKRCFAPNPSSGPHGASIAGAIDASTDPPVRYERNRIAARLVWEPSACPRAVPFENHQLLVCTLGEEVFERGFGERTKRNAESIAQREDYLLDPRRYAVGEDQR
jgi:hypothetical protein